MSATCHNGLLGIRYINIRNLGSIVKNKEYKENKPLTSPDHAHKANTYFPSEITNLNSVILLLYSQGSGLSSQTT